MGFAGPSRRALGGRSLQSIIWIAYIRPECAARAASRDEIFFGNV